MVGINCVFYFNRLYESDSHDSCFYESSIWTGDVGKCFHSVMKHKVGICTMTNQLMLDGISIIMHLERSSKSV